jgi:acetolactate synthase-1/2/3 large subunit
MINNTIASTGASGQAPQVVMTKVADYVASFLAEHGVRVVFAVTGGGAMHLNDSLGFHPDLQCVFVHHEQAASMAAEGYARVTELPAAVNVTTGPGAINALNGVFGAYTDSIPMIVLSGQVKRETLLACNPVPGLRQLGDQEIDAVAMVSSIVKYVALVKDPQSIRYHLEKALHLATTGRKGPVWLDIPIDVQASKVDVSSLPGYTPEPAELPPSGAMLQKQCREVLRRLRAAERPSILVGTGIRRAGALDVFRRVAHKLGIPVATAWTAIDVLGSDDPVYCGRPGTVGDRPGNFTVQNSDVLLVVGCRLAIRQISYNWQSFARAAYKIMVDVDEAELRKPMMIPDLPVQADAKAFFEELERQIDAGEGAGDHVEWLQWCKERVARYPVVRAEQREIHDREINPYHFIDRLFAHLEPDDVVACGNATACVVTFQAAVVKEGQRIFANAGSASMGYDLPASIGAAVALGGGRVICLAGDGSLQMNIQELQTVVHHKLPIKIFVLNNDGYLSCRLTQSNFFKRLAGEGPSNGVSFPDTVKIGTAYGLKAFRAEGADFEKTIVQALTEDGPVICDVILDPKQGFEPKLSARQLPDGRIISPALEDLAPFLPPEELKENLLIPAADA